MEFATKNSILKLLKTWNQKGFKNLLWLSLVVIFLTNCSLNNAEDTGPKPGNISDDVDFSWDLWPELEENQPLKDLKIEAWPKLNENSVLLLGDESLQGNWGLVLQKTFVSPGENSWILSTCMSARDFKNGGQSPCGYWTQPFQQTKSNSVYITADQTQNAERIAPKIISDENVKTVVISFGHRISKLESNIDIQLELSAIELMARWAHSAGKKCYVIEPTDAYYVETHNSDFLNKEEKGRLRIAVSDYCDWIDANKLRDDFLNETHIPVDEIISNKSADTEDDFIVVDQPTFTPEGETEEPNADTSVMPPPPDRPSSLPQAVPMDELIEREKQKLLDQNSDKSKSQEPVADESTSLARPRARPVRISRSAQKDIRQRIESNTNSQSQNVVIAQESGEPKYLWNGHKNGATLTSIGKKYLRNKTASYLTQTQALRDVKTYCPKYKNLSASQREKFWLYLYSAIARYENHKFDPMVKHREKKSGRHSVGIFQVDTKNCGYGADSNKAQLYDMDNNFRCALTKGTALVKSGKQVADGRYVTKTRKDGTTYTEYSDYGLDGYWSVMRSSYRGAAMNSKTGKYENVALGRRQEIAQLTNSIAICK